MQGGEDGGERLIPTFDTLLQSLSMVEALRSGDGSGRRVGGSTGGQLSKEGGCDGARESKV